MRHFLRIAGGVDVLPVLHALQAKPELWNRHDLRTTHPRSPHTACDDIWVRFNAYEPDDPAAVIDAVQAVAYPAWTELPQLRGIVLDLMRRVEGVQLGRVIISRLAPGKRIEPHVDEGAPASFYRRYQIALQSLPGCVFHIEDEAVSFQAGEVWMIDNRATHWVENNSADDRIAVVVDIRLGDDA
jgi:Aspartyl/Asparaginyl beta-hydroxylase